MDTLNINPKFKEALPSLSDEELLQLEQSILADGVRESIKVWGNTIIDGHNRYQICQKHDLPYPTMNMFFKDEDTVLEWIYSNQIGRRNLSDHQKALYIGRLYNLRKKKVGAPEGSKNAAKNNSATVAQLIFPRENNKSDTVTELIPETTADALAKELKVSPRTIKTAGKVVEVIEEHPELEEKFLNKEITQKTILQMAEPKRATKIFDDEVLAEILQKQGHSLVVALNKLNVTLKRCKSVLKGHNINISDYAPRLAGLNVDELLTQARKIKKGVTINANQ